MSDLAGAPVVHISSAVVRTRPEHMDAVARAINKLVDAEVFHAVEGRIVVVLESPDTDSLGRCLNEIALIDGVLSANMVYERVEPLAFLGDAP